MYTVTPDWTRPVPRPANKRAARKTVHSLATISRTIAFGKYNASRVIGLSHQCQRHENQVETVLPAETVRDERNRPHSYDLASGLDAGPSPDMIGRDYSRSCRFGDLCREDVDEPRISHDRAGNGDSVSVEDGG